MTNTGRDATEKELENVRDSLQFPDDTDWEAKATVLQHQDNLRILFTADDWTAAMDHPFAGLEALFTEESEEYIHDTAGPGVHIAFRLVPDMRDGRPILRGTVHPALAAPDGDRFAIPDSVIARAEIHLEFQSRRTEQLVAAATEERQGEVPPVTAVSTERYLPDVITPTEVDITVLTCPEEASTLVGPDWRAALEEDIAGAMAEVYTPATERHGHTLIFRFAFRAENNGGLTAHATLHPVIDGSMEMEEDLNHTVSEATIRMRAKEPALQARLLSYVRTNYG